MPILIIPILAGIILLALLAMIACGAWLAHQMTSVERVALFGHPQQLNLHWQDVSFPSRGDQLPLSGWYLPAAQDDRCIILIQGTEHHRNSPEINALQLARDLVQYRFSVFLFDFRGRGQSGGSRSSEGHREQWDTLGAIDYVSSRGIPPERIGLLGFSLGAGVSILVAAQEPRIPAIVSDSGFTDYLMDLRHLRLGPIPLPAWCGAFVLLAGRLFFQTDLRKVRPIQVINQIESPIFFIHGERDPIVPAHESRQLYTARNQYPQDRIWQDRIWQDRIWMVPNAEHVNVYRKRPQEYIARIASFYNRHIP